MSGRLVRPPIWQEGLESPWLIIVMTLLPAGRRADALFRCRERSDEDAFVDLHLLESKQS